MKPPKDKRTREYKEWFAKYGETYEMEINSSKGAGDLVEKTLRKAGIKKKEGCGCDERKEILNKAFRYSYGRKVVRCLTPEQAEDWGKFLEEKGKHLKAETYNFPITEDQKKMILDLGKHLFATDYTKDFQKGCSTCKKYLIIDINRVYEY